MSEPNVPPDDMATPPLDPDTADRLLGGSIHPDDAPAGYRRVAALIAAAREPAATAERSEAPAGLAELVTSSPSAPEPTGRSRRRFAAAAVAATVLLGASGAAAATNNLPAPVQRTVASIGSYLGLNIPEPEGPADTSPGTTTPEAEVELPSVPDPGDVVDERFPDPNDLLPNDPVPDPVDELGPEPPVTEPVQPTPVDPPLTSESCAPGEILDAAGTCIPDEGPPVSEPEGPESEIQAGPTSPSGRGPLDP